MVSDAPEHRSFSARAVAVGAVASACLTWLCVGWFGAQGPLTAAIAVILVELFLASFGMIAILLAARVSDTYLELESRSPEQPPRDRQLWLWRPIWQPSLRWDRGSKSSPVSTPHGEHWPSTVNAETDPSARSDMLTFPPQAEQSRARDNNDRRRAA